MRNDVVRRGRLSGERTGEMMHFLSSMVADRHIAEVLRVLKTGGRFVIIETSQSKQWFIRKLNHLYLCYFVFVLGLLISGNREAYHYLAESAANYYSPEELKKILVEAGFRQVCFRRLLFGAVSIHTATK